MKKYGKLIPLLLLSAFLLSGCLIKSGDELLQLPKSAENYLALQIQLDRTLKKGASYAAPETGEYRSTIQLKDLDGDGEDEAIVFFRESDNNGKFSVCLYKKEKDQYTMAGKISGTGTAVYAVDYPQIDADGNRAIVVSWTLGTDLNRGMTVSRLQNGKLDHMLDTEYTAYTFSDLDQDGQKELLTFAPDDQGRQAARLFHMQEDKVEEVSDLTMHASRSIVRLTEGRTADRELAVYVEQKSSDGAGFFTDILVYHQDQLLNLTKQARNTDMDTYRTLMIYTRDVDQDNVMEIPEIRSVIPLNSQDNGASDAVYLLDWYRYSRQNAPQKAMTCFANFADDWILKCPESWQSGVTAIWRSSADGNACIRFQTAQTQPVGLAEIYKIEKEAAAYYTEQADCVVLGTQEHYVYVAKLLETPASNPMGLSGSQIKSMFSTITGDWIA